MNREDAVKIWRDIAFGSPDSLVTERMIQQFANKIESIERDACAKTCDEMVDWQLTRHPCASILDSHEYLIGIRRGVINATNAIRDRSKQD